MKWNHNQPDEVGWRWRMTVHSYVLSDPYKLYCVRIKIIPTSSQQNFVVRNSLTNRETVRMISLTAMMMMHPSQVSSHRWRKISFPLSCQSIKPYMLLRLNISHVTPTPSKFICPQPVFNRKALDIFSIIWKLKLGHPKFSLSRFSVDNTMMMLKWQPKSSLSNWNTISATE